MIDTVFGRFRAAAGAMLAGLCLIAGAVAEEADPTLDAAAVEPAPQTIGVFGDSIADGLWIGLTGAFRSDPRVERVVQLSEVSTGLTNWIYRDISTKTADQLAQGRYDVAVVLFGSNDIQGIVDEAGAVHPFRSAGWEAIYTARIDDVIGQLKDHGAIVIWVGLPAMRSARYDGNVQYLNTLFEARAAAAGVRFVSTREASAGPDGGYSAYLPDARGVDRLMRADDGLHFTPPGYRRTAAPGAAAIEESWLTPPAYLTQTRDAAEALISRLEVIDGQLWACVPAETGPYALPDPGAAGPGLAAGQR